MEREVGAAAVRTAAADGIRHIDDREAAPAVVAGLALAAERRDARVGVAEAVRERHAEHLVLAVDGVADAREENVVAPAAEVIRVGQREDALGAVDLHARNLGEEALGAEGQAAEAAVFELERAEHHGVAAALATDFVRDRLLVTRMARILVDALIVLLRVAGNTVDRAEHVDEDVDVVAAHVVGDRRAGGACGGVGRVARGIVRIVAAVAHGVRDQWAADGAVVEQLSRGLERRAHIAVRRAAEAQALCCGEVVVRLRALERVAHRLFGVGVLAGLEDLARDGRMVPKLGCIDNDLDFRIVQNLLVCHLADAEELRARLAALGDDIGAADDVDDVETALDERVQIGVADIAAADEGDLYGLNCGHDNSSLLNMQDVPHIVDADFQAFKNRALRLVLLDVVPLDARFARRRRNGLPVQVALTDFREHARHLAEADLLRRTVDRVVLVVDDRDAPLELFNPLHRVAARGGRPEHVELECHEFRVCILDEDLQAGLAVQLREIAEFLTVVVVLQADAGAAERLCEAVELLRIGVKALRAPHHNARNCGRTEHGHAVLFRGFDRFFRIFDVGVNAARL